jgi:hypothetical protein
MNPFIPQMMTQVAFSVKEQGTTVLEVTGADGTTYEVKIGLVVPAVFDTNARNPLDGMPILNIPINAVVQVRTATNA